MIHNCYIGFYDMSKVQGFWGTLIRVFTNTNVTHVAPIIETATGFITFTIINGGKIKVTKLEAFEKLEVEFLDGCYVGAIDTSLEEIFKYSENYSEATTWSVFRWFFFTRFFTKKYPKVCTTFVCDLYKLPYTDKMTRVIPVHLYRRLKNDCNYARWESPSRQNNGG